MSVLSMCYMSYAQLRPHPPAPSPSESRAVKFSRRGKSGKPSPLRGEGRVRGGAGNPGAAVSAASALTPALSLKGEGELDSPAPSERGPGGEVGLRDPFFISNNVR